MSRDNWRYIDAETYCVKVTDGTHDSPKSKEFGKPLVTSKHIKGRNIDFENAYLISEDDYKKANQRSKVDQWDVLVSMIGEYCGFCYVERNQEINYAVKNVGIYKTGSKLKAEWLYYYLNSSEGKKQLLSSRSGSSQPYITLGALRSFQILFPDSENEAQGILNTLSALDAKIELNQRINAELESMAKTLYDYWFVQFAPHKSAGGKMVWNEELKRDVPAGWEVAELGNYAQPVRGVTYKKDEIRKPSDKNAIPILRATNITNGVIDLNDMVYVPEEVVSKEQYLNKFDVLITMSSGSKAHVGKNAFYYFDQKVSFGAFCSKLTVDKSMRYYVNTQMRSDSFKKYISNVGLGTNINNLTNKHITEYKLLIPPEELLLQYEKTVQGFYNKIANNQKESQTLTELRNWLLPILMNGQVRVT